MIFVVSNAMTPSEADRQPWLVAGVYVPSDALGDRVSGTLQILTLGFLFTVGVNAVMAVALWVLEALVIGFQHRH